MKSKYKLLKQMCHAFVMFMFITSIENSSIPTLSIRLKATKRNYFSSSFSQKSGDKKTHNKTR